MRKISDKQCNLTSKAIREEEQKKKPNVSSRKEIIKIRSEINETNEGNDSKDQQN